jgi:uncharacterized membrane protein
MISRKRLSAALTIILGLLVLGAAAAVAVVLAGPSLAPEEPFTEFYILGQGGKAAGYPTEFDAGSEQTVIVGIVSHEAEVITYRVEVNAGGPVIAAAGPVVLAPQEKHEGPLSFTLENAGSRQQVMFLLYREGEPGAYRSLDLWVDVSPQR